MTKEPGMSQDLKIDYRLGLNRDQLEAAAELYDEAFGKKFAVAIKSRQDRLKLYESTFNGKFALSASVEAKLVGLAGFHTTGGSLTGGITPSVLLTRLGFFRGLRATLIFSLYERKPTPGQLLMDGIAVRSDYRGHGIGSQLLQELQDYARRNGFANIRLDVIDTNPGARRLYERLGFVAVRTERFPFLRWLLGFGGSTMMELRVDISD